jgi:cytochrome c553
MNKTLTSLLAALALTTLPALSYSQAIKGDIKAGEGKNAMCIGCHGIKGYQASFPEVYKVPMISGQGAAYIAASLKAYQTGDRKHPTMKAIAANLTEQDMADLGAYYEQHGKVAGAAALPATPSKQPNEKVKAILDRAALSEGTNCLKCHGTNFSKPQDPSQPKLAGQHKDYLFAALKSYQTEGNSKIGRNNGVMKGIVEKFNEDPKDLKNKLPMTSVQMRELANYIGSLEGELTVTPQNKFR